MLEYEVSQCQRCILYKSITKRVCGKGNSKAPIVLVGEAPGENEDREGLPFVGRAGLVLTTMLKRASFDRELLYVTNVLRCRPPDNRTPTKAEISACSRFLFKEIETIQPRVIVCLGNTAADTLIGKKHYGTMEKAHGDVYRVMITPTLAIPAVPTWHPASFLRPHPQIRMKYALDDLEKVLQVMQFTADGSVWKDYVR